MVWIRIAELYNRNVLDDVIDLCITEQFLERLRTQRPVYLSGAYVFGSMYPLKQYQCVGSHGNDGAQTGILLLLPKKTVDPRLNNPKLWKKILGRYEYDYNRPTLLDDLQRQMSDKILFIGETRGGDVGASIFIHRDQNRSIDSIRIVPDATICHTD